MYSLNNAVNLEEVLRKLVHFVDQGSSRSKINLFHPTDIHAKNINNVDTNTKGSPWDTIHLRLRFRSIRIQQRFRS